MIIKNFLEKINNKILSYSWQKDQYFREKGYLEKTLEADKLQLKELTIFLLRCKKIST